jgi:hypothetical protein
MACAMATKLDPFPEPKIPKRSLWEFADVMDEALMGEA